MFKLKSEYDVEGMMEYLIESCICTEDELRLVMYINGQNQETMESILYARTGYRSFRQLDDVCFESDEDEEDDEKEDEK